MKDGFTFEVSAKLKKAFEEMPEKATKAASASLYQEAEKIMTDSKENYVPVDTATLKGSGTVLLPEVKNRQVTVTMGYGGNAEDYALIQHENLEFKHPNGGQAKYLEIPFKKAVGEGMKNRIGEYIFSAIGGN